MKVQILTFVLVFGIAYFMRKKSRCPKKRDKAAQKEKKWYETIRDQCSKHEFYF